MLFPLALSEKDHQQLADRSPLDQLSVKMILDPANYLQNPIDIHALNKVFVDHQAKL